MQARRSRAVSSDTPAQFLNGLLVGFFSRPAFLNDYATPIVVFVVSRCLLLVSGAYAPRILGTLHSNRVALPSNDPLWNAGTWFRPWFRFDTAWYVDVSQHGYHWGALGHANTNFFPLYPILIHIVQPFTLGSAWLAAWIVSNVAFLVALILLYQWACIRWDATVALRTVLLISVFPFTFFYFAPYAESLFLALAVGAFLAVERDKWPQAVICAGLASVARPVGIAVIFGLVVYAAQRGEWRRVAGSAFAVLPFLSFVIFLGIEVGHPLGFLTYHSAGWVSPHGDIVATVGSQFRTRLAPLDRIDAAVVAIFALSIVGIWRKPGLSYAAFTIAGLGLPLLHGLVSMERYVIVLFPSFALWGSWSNRALQATLFCFCLLFSIISAVLYCAGFSLF